MSYYYLATSYSKHPAGLDAAFIMASQNAALLLRAGVPVFSPIAHSHPIAVHGEINPLDHDIWLPFDRPMMEGAKLGLIILCSEGWEESFGIAAERKVFAEFGRPEFLMTPGQVPDLPGGV